jgi:hypothetical protein
MACGIQWWVVVVLCCCVVYVIARMLLCVSYFVFASFFLKLVHFSFNFAFCMEWCWFLQSIHEKRDKDTNYFFVTGFCS